jgi:LmbE family N-acetylglucosaminyl deacetylase
MRSIYVCIVLFISFISGIHSQIPSKPTSGQIYKSLERLNFLGTVLYNAAHPDDENTNLITYLSNNVNAETYYLSLTRGDGGQNMIGPEIFSLLGVLRTQELLAARRIDNGKQLFSRANDFGFSKNAEETLTIWDEKALQQDIIWLIRKIRPDVIINRFDHNNSGSTHGHHTAASVLMNSVFDKSNDPTVYPEQLKFVKPWQARRLYFNTSWWFYGSEEAFEKADKSKLTTLNIGTYYPQLGFSNQEIAAMSRSMHKCQGFGSAGSRGEQNEYLNLLKGDMPAMKDDIFHGINTTWTRVEGGAPIKKLMDNVLRNFNYSQPQSSIQDLVQVKKLISGLKDEFWRTKKLVEIDKIIADCLGLFAEGVTQNNFAVRGQRTDVNVELISRNLGGVTLNSIEILPYGIKSDFNGKILGKNERFTSKLSFNIAESEPFTTAYWLKKQGTLGMLNVDDQTLVGLPETPRNLRIRFSISVLGEKMDIERDLVYKFTDRGRGEVYQPFEIVPEASVSIKEKVLVFADENPKKLSVEVKSFSDKLQGELRLDLPDGWKSVPESFDINYSRSEYAETYEFMVIPPLNSQEVKISALLKSNEKLYREELISIDYEHIPLQRVLVQSESSLIKLDIKKSGNEIAYLMGTGDEVPQSLRQIGYNVTEINVGDITRDRLKSFDALIFGVRAYNKFVELKNKQNIIFDFVRNGGNFIVQYNVNGRDLKVNQNEFLPYPLEISRERVTVEQAPVKILAPNHAVLNFPNKITAKDFDGWVQERGLYFPTKWDKNFTAVLSCNDPGEPARDGGLLIAPFGKGNVVYTGYAFFRQLPEGVSGAYKLFTNMISLPKQEVTP